MEGLLASGGPRANPSPTDSDGPTVEVSTDAVSTTARAQAAPYAEEVPGENGKAETQQGASEDLQLTLISSEVAHPFKPSQSLPDMQGSDTQSTITCVPDAEFSPSVQWIMDKADEKQAFQGGFAVDVLSNPATPGKWMNFLSVRMKPPVHAPLPPQDEAMRLLEVFFSAHNRFFPLYDYPSFMLLAQQEFAGQPDKRVGWWASLNAALAVGIRLQNPADTSRESSAQAWGYMHNALSVLPELTMRSDDLLSAQALLCMAVFTRGNGEPPSSAMLVSSALRLLQIMGLRQGKPSTERDPVIARQSNRTFWFAYMLDTENTMVSNLPLLQDPSTLNIELPAEESPDGLGTIPLEDGTGQFNLFRAMSELSVIAAKAFQALYAPNVRQRPETEIVKTMLDLEQQLEEWKAAIDIDFQPEYEINTADPYLRHYILVLHFQYYTCLSNIHFAALTLRRSTGDTSCQNQIISSRAIYSSCARAMVRMTRNVAVDIPAFVWRILCYPILASMALFVGIREDPTAPRALTDAALLGSWTSLLSKMKDHDSGSVGQIRRLLLELERLSREVVNQAQSTSKGNKCTGTYMFCLSQVQEAYSISTLD
ncbi:hypothetical protein A1O3_06679 [Capronia epimyces CBS 606.96]|uniref:Xylanolytic transcriptional activator regulatory domain-containing protein n=1 Tax=Capronia epimyces CBS 606.96 TaxID=1182542 RepID=W9YKU0_9EURO|nr:uncharacterized protein A1O3_06679 [Capronia epimyces CBS 606.96]EXJ82864.1 hypothetical protein A1O3_06679 [Capronia epimyces CBS 606.96]